jgi:hypothetical protein
MPTPCDTITAGQHATITGLRGLVWSGICVYQDVKSITLRLDVNDSTPLFDIIGAATMLIKRTDISNCTIP